MVAASRRAALSPASASAVIAYDSGATFRLEGTPGRIIEDVINISPEGAFVAVAIGYGFEEERGRRLALQNDASGSAPPLIPGDIRLGNIPASALIEGFRVNPRFEHLVLETPVNGDSPDRRPVRDRTLVNKPVPIDLLTDDKHPTLFERIKIPEEISFFLSIIDSGSGRELQDEPTHNLASLGKSNGERPFRLLAQPISFAPRSTVRLQVIERTEGVKGTLFIVLYGYKVLGSSGCPEPVARKLTGPWQCPVETIGRPSDRIIPFDYVVTIPLSGRFKNLLENETTVNAEGGFVATSVGYGLLVEEAAVPVQTTSSTASSNGGTGILRGLKLAAFPPSALLDGIRLKSNFLRLAFGENAELANDLPAALAPEMFERLNRPEDVSFRYAIFDSGRGRELQNQPLHNVAGLGIANGDRPFKRLARPMVFLPRSTIRIQVEERFGRGTLFFVFQGYKILSPSMAGGRA